MSAVTGWFPPDVKPVHVGVYQTYAESEPQSGNPGYQFWRGNCWSIFSSDADSAERDKNIDSFYQINYWRGLAEKP
jgi:hypothetical protein